MRVYLFAVVLLTATSGAQAAVQDLPNFVAYPEGFASAGQPNAAQYVEIAEAGYDRVIYLAYNDSPQIKGSNDRDAHAAGLDYIHVAVRFDEPRYTDFAAFAALMQMSDQHTLVHCQVNYRASAFSFLYRVIYEDVAVADAKQAVDAVWQPNETWQAFMRATLEKHGKSMDCAGCDWRSDGTKD
ncbi:MAG: protein tyrosine phosphatase family protein [Pseudomonadota bacterium]